jgi:hypothetical protein
MAYGAEISRINPTCYLFLIDQSGSMADPLPDSTRRKADIAADALNNLLRNLSLRCARTEGVRDYFYVGIIGYGATVGSAFGGVLTGRELIPISEIANSPLRIDEKIKKTEDGAGGLVDVTEKFPIWIDPITNNGTPMCQALQQTENIMHKWLASHPDCFPPTILNITDGEANDGDPRGVANNLKALVSSDGPILLLNAHISSKKDPPISFTDEKQPLPDEHAQLLFEMSSIMPDKMRGVAREYGYTPSETSRGYVFKADPVTFIQWLEIGTRAANLR